MIGELIAIGDELTSGRVANTTSGHAAHQLFLLGHQIRAMHTIGDDVELIGMNDTPSVRFLANIIITIGMLNIFLIFFSPYLKKS